MDKLAHKHLLAAYAKQPKVLALVKRNGVLSISYAENTPFIQHISRSVVGQQLSVTAAKTIWGRVAELHAQSKLPFDQFLNVTVDQALRDCGLSFAKIKTIKGLAAGSLAGELDERCLRHASSYQELHDILIPYWGVGQWTVEMMAMFFFEMPDLWSDGDVGLQNALKALHPRSETQRRRTINRAKPYRSYLALHMWQALDNNLFA